MNKLIRRIVLVVVVLVVFGVAIIPPEKKIRLGKDLRGGVTLLYDVRLEPGENPDEIIPRMIEVLRQRVDPNGLFEISFVRQGRDRVEVTMPLPGRVTREFREKFDAAVEELTSLAISESEIERLASEQDIQRRARLLDQLAGDSDNTRALLISFLEAADLSRLADARGLSATADPDATAEERSEALAAAREAKLARDAAKARVTSASPSRSEIEQALARSPNDVELRDPRSDEVADVIASPRSQAIDGLKQRYPGAAEQIESVVAAWDEYNANRDSLDDPSDLIRLLRAAGVLSFRITVDAQGSGVDFTPIQIQEFTDALRDFGPGAPVLAERQVRWLRINDILNFGNISDVGRFQMFQADPVGYFGSQLNYIVAEVDGEFWVLCHDRPGRRLLQNTDGAGIWRVSRSFQSTDEFGRPAIAFQMDPRGARLLGELTGNNLGNNMAVILDDEVYTAPRLQGRITSNGQITGNFSPDDINYVVRVLSAGSLQAKLSPDPIGQTTIGPELGKDNLVAGLRAGVIAIIAVAIFMIVYYMKAGLVASLALLCNAILILGALSLNKAVLTLPGIAGIILTFGMAVDANVLIYERIREELRAGKELKESIRLGYQKALSSIVDGNVTNLIVCIVLVLPGVSTQEVKGFAITLGIGVIATLFSTLVITRLIFTILAEHLNMKKLSMLPTVIPALERTFEPSIDWMKARWGFVIFSAIVVSLGMIMVATRGSKMLDTEFVGGTQIELRFKDGQTLTRPEVQERINAIIQTARETPTTDDDILLSLSIANLVAIQPRPGDDGLVVSDRFQVRTTIVDDQILISAMKDGFEGLLDVQPSINFDGEERLLVPYSGEPDSLAGLVAPVQAIGTDDLIRSLPQGFLPEGSETRTVTDFDGGVAIVLRNISPALSIDAMRVKLDELRRTDPAYRQTLGRRVNLHVLTGTDQAVTSAVMLVSDPEFSFNNIGQGQVGQWYSQFAYPEARLAAEALGRETTLAGVQKVSASVAETFKTRAMLAIFLSFTLIMAYIWVRFGNVRYSLASIVCLVHDVLACIGLIALAEIVYEWETTQSIAQSLGIMPFRIDLTMVAAILTIIGYSLNDTIIVMDRIRENRGKLPYATRKIVNLSINQTISRTVITSGTTLLAVLILYNLGGEGVRSFSYGLLVGILFGTYSSIAIAAPLVWSKKRDKSQEREGVDRDNPVVGGRAEPRRLD